MNSIRPSDVLAEHLVFTGATFRMAKALVQAYPQQQRPLLSNALRDFGGSSLIEAVNAWIQNEMEQADLRLDLHVMTWLSSRLDQFLVDQEVNGYV